jgi:hypothetical protein
MTNTLAYYYTELVIFFFFFFFFFFVAVTASKRFLVEFLILVEARVLNFCSLFVTSGDPQNDSGEQSYKTFYRRNLLIFVIG